MPALKERTYRTPDPIWFSANEIPFISGWVLCQLNTASDKMWVYVDYISKRHPNI